MPIPESEPIGENEWLLRLVWEDRFDNGGPPVSPNAFVPRAGKHPDTDGISLFRESCVESQTDILAVIAEDKHRQYGIVRVPVSMLAGLNLTVQPSPIKEVPGHVVLPELNIDAYNANKGGFTFTKVTLAQVASSNIVRQPPSKLGTS